MSGWASPLEPRGDIVASLNDSVFGCLHDDADRHLSRHDVRPSGRIAAARVYDERSVRGDDLVVEPVMIGYEDHAILPGEERRGERRARHVEVVFTHLREAQHMWI